MALTVAVRRKAVLPPELLAYCLHTTATQQQPANYKPRERTKSSSSGPKPSSRTRLVKDLKPRSGSSSSHRLRIAPKLRREEPPPPPPPVRDPAPHHEATDSFKEWEERRIAGKAHKERLARRADRPLRKPSSWQRALASQGLRDLDRPRPSSKGKERAREDDQGAPTASEPDAQRKKHVYNPLSDEFDVASKSVSTRQLPDGFSSPPLMEGLQASLLEHLGPDAKPTPIQALSMKHLLKPPSQHSGSDASSRHHQCLLASETGSGKSIAYLLPMLQNLKQSELQDKSTDEVEVLPTALNPRGIILAPTHELSRQLSGFAKSLLHGIKLRVICASQANTTSRPRKAVNASDMAREAEQLTVGSDVVSRNAQSHPVDIVVGTPSKILEMLKGRGWNYEEPNLEDGWGKDERGKPKKLSWTVGKPEMGGSKIEWVVVDEADVLFDPDFQEHTRRILAEISQAKGNAVPFNPVLSNETPEKPINYPFNLLLTTATIPAALATYLDTHHPSLLRLASPRLHHLPSTLQTEYMGWTGGNKSADVDHRLRRVWADDAARGAQRSRVLVFCNRSTRVEELAEHLRGKGVACVALTSTSETRRHGSNHHLDGFLKGTEAPAGEDAPLVMITTSLLSRGLDFSPEIRHVFIVDEPRNMVDFLHRAGRSGRAGEQGKVVVFGKMKGRGSESTRVMKQKVRALAA